MEHGSSMEAGHLHLGFCAHCCSRRGLVGSSAQPRGIRWTLMVSQVVSEVWSAQSRTTQSLVAFSTRMPPVTLN
jgi:sulfur relay (sulfurtransferase) complex TusBCD TusD component (DsrE family)